MSAPSKNQQIRLLEDMYRTYNLEQLEEIEYVEAHGTGTQAGDLAEAHALGEFFNSRGSSKKKLIGSIKTNIGHLEAAAGVAGLIKVLLMMEHSKIVPSLFSGNLNKKIDFDKLNLTVVSELKDWKTEQKVASVNSFGFGGSNCHAIVRSVATNRDDIPRPNEGEGAHYLVSFSGKDDVSLMGSLKDLVEHKELKSLNLKDISFTSTRRRDHYSKRKAFVVASIEEFIGKVKALPQPETTAMDFRQVSTVFVFGGMGTSWNGMCQEMLVKSDVFRSTLRDIDTCLQKHVNWSLIERLNAGKDLNDPLCSPIAIFACQIGLARLWQSLDVKPAVVVGQSVGEVAAAYISDRLSLEDVVLVLYERSLLLSTVMGGKMFRVKDMDINLVKDAMPVFCNKANVSVEYSPLSCAVSCDPEMVEGIKSHLLDVALAKNMPINFFDLPVLTAYHSHHMDSIKTLFRDKLITISSNNSSTSLPMVSTVTGELVNGALDTNYWMNNLREPVKLYDAVRTSYRKNDMNIYIEIGPRPVLKAHMQNVFTEPNVANFASMTQNVEWKQFVESVADIYCQGVDIDWVHFPQQGRLVTPVPRYCFHTRKGFHKSEQAHLALAGVNCLRHTYPYVYKKSSTEGMVMISQNTFPSVYEHKVSNMLVIPGAFYAEIGFAMTKFHHEMKAPMYTVSAEFKQLFRLPREGSTLLSIECLKIPTQINSCESESDRYKVIIKNKEALLATLELHALKFKINCPKVNIEVLKGRCPIQVKKTDIYNSLRKYGFTYGPKFTLLEGAHRSEHECIAEIVIPESLSLEIPGTTIHPSVIDCMMQTSAILEDNSGEEQEQEMLPITIGKLTSYREIEKKMYIIATQKEQQGDSTFYDITLTTLDGQVIAHMENLSHTIVSKKTESFSTIYNCVWTKLDKISPNQKTESHKVLFITDYIPPNTPEDTLAMCHLFNSLQKPWDIFNGNVPTFNSSFDFIVVLIMNCNISDSDDGDMVLEKTLNLCLFLQHLYYHALTQRFKKPIFVFTKDAFQLESTEDRAAQSHRVNPIMTSLWGLFRCAVHESIHELVFAVDLHVSTDDLSLPFLTSIAERISCDVSLQSYPEFLITDEYMYVNEIVKLGSGTHIPNFRLNHADRSTNCIKLSSHPSTLATTCCVYKRLRKESHNVEIDISEAAIQNPNLYSVNCLYGDGEASARFSEEGFMIFPLEIHGVMLSDKSQNLDVVSCFPVPLGSKVVVPKMVTIDTNMFYQYKLGDVTQLTVLRALCSMVKTSSVTVVASKSTFHLAQCLDIMLKTFYSSKNVNIVMIEQLYKSNRVNETVISLVLIDKAIIWAIDSMADKPKQFITAYTLIKDARTLFSITFPSIHLDLLDTEQLFSPNELITAIPQLTEWITKQNIETKLVLELIHSHQDLKIESMHEQANDLRTLLEFQHYKMNFGLVKVAKSDLFCGDSVYLVVGGLTGLGWLTVRHLAENGAGCIAILNRRNATADMMSAISLLSLATRCDIGVFKCDVSDFDALKDVFTSINIKFLNKALRGIFFSAAVLQDKPLLDLWMVSASTEGQRVSLDRVSTGEH